MAENLQVFKEADLDKIQLGSSPSISPLLKRVKKEILKVPGEAALLSEVVKELEGGDAKQVAAMAGKFKRYCGEKGKDGFKVVTKDRRNVLVSTV